MNYSLEVKNVNHKIGNKVILEDITFDVEANTIIGLLGPNGVGKSTLLRRIANTEETSGTIAINGIANDFTKFRTDVLLVTNKIDVPMFLSLYDYCKLLEISFTIDYDFVDRYCQRLGVDKHKSIHTLSTGTKEITQLIACLATSASLILLDEPLSAIDIYKRDIILEMIIDSKLNGKTIILTTHLIDDISSILDKVLYIHDSKIEFYLDCEEIEESSDTLSSYLKANYGEA